MIFWVLSFLIVAFGQPAWVPGLGIFSAAFGYALFWKGMLQLPKRRFWLAVFWFAGVQGVQLSWMATLDYMGPLIIGVYLFLIFAMGVQFGLISLLVEENLSWLKSLAIAGIWVMFEWVRLFFLCGFTWNMVGLSLTDSIYSLQFAALFGVFGLSFWVILVNLAALKKRGALWAGLALFPYLFGVGHFYWVERKGDGKELNVALVQTHLMPEEKDFYSNHPKAYIQPLVQWDRILKALRAADLKKVDLIVLPEAALPLGAHTAGYAFNIVSQYFPQEALAPLKRPYAVFDRGMWKVSNAFLLQTLANEYGAEVISGLDDRDVQGKYNAAFHFLPERSSYERYEKQVLVPVGEYIPLQGLKGLTRFIEEQFGIYSSFDCGKEGKVFQGRVPIGISICVEETFAHLIRDLRSQGAEVFVNVTNDAWFPRSKLARQHLEHGRVRAVENGVPILRACNAGVTCGIDSLGRSIAQIESTSKDPHVLSFSLPLRSYKTLYSFWGDAGILGISLSCLLFYFCFEKKKLL